MVMVQMAVYPWSAAVTVIVVVPEEIAVNNPPELTDTIVGLFDVHVTDLFVVFEGIKLAVSCSVLPTFNVEEPGAIETPVA